MSPWITLMITGKETNAVVKFLPVTALELVPLGQKSHRRTRDKK